MTHTGRILLLAITLASPGLLWSQSSTLESRSLTLRQYAAELDRASSALAASNPLEVQAYREELPPEWVVEGESEYRIEVGTDWLREALEAAEPRPVTNEAVVEEAKQRLASLREAAIQLAQPQSTPSADRARSQLDAILSAREFQKASGPSSFDLWKARFYDWIVRQLARLLGGFGRAPVTSGMVLWVVVIVTALVVAVWAARSLVGSELREPIDLREARSPAPDWRQWAWEARAAADHGDYRTAIHNAYWASIYKLEAIELLPEGRSRTPRESLRLIDRQSAVYEPVALLTRGLELVWYGYRTATLADWTDATRHLELLECLQPSTRATAGS
jgi:hypothetical protein